MFARKFDHEVKSSGPYDLIRASLEDHTLSSKRIGQARARIGKEPSSIVEGDHFCNRQGAARLRRELAELEQERERHAERRSRRRRR